MSIKYFVVFQLIFLLFAWTSVDAQTASVEDLCKDSLATSRHTEVFEKAIRTKSVSGAMVSSDGKGIEGVTVAVTDKTYSEVALSVLTDNFGRFGFHKLKPARYYLIVCKQGFDPIKLTVDLKPRHSEKKIKFTLNPS